MSRFRPQFTLSLFVLAHFSHHVITAITAPLLPLIRSTFDLSYTQAGFLLSAYTISYGIAHLPSGWLSGRIGPLFLILVGIVGVGASGLLAGVAWSFALLVTAQLLMGLSGSGYHPAASYFISRVTPPAKRGRALGIHVTGGSASYFLSPILAAMIAAAWGWRGSYITLAIPTILFGVVLSLLLSRVSRHNRQKPLKTEEQKGDASSVPWVKVIAFLALTTLGGALTGSVIGFIPLYLVDTYGVQEETAAGLLAIIFSAGIWVAPLAGYLSDRLGRLPMVIIASFAAGPVIILLNYMPLGFGFYALLLLIGIYIFVRMPVSEAYIYGEVPLRLRSTLLGVYFFGSSLGGGALTPVIGWIADHYSFLHSFWIAGGTLFILTILCSGLILGSRLFARRVPVS
jgi:MFS family permease